MRKLAGYLCHRASVRLHEAAVWALDWDVEQGRGWHAPPKFMQGLLGSDHRYLEFHDVAPRLAAAVDVVRHKLERMRTMALRRIGL